MIVRYCMRLASFRAGFRAVKAFTGAAICTSCVAITKSYPGVLRCFKATYPHPATYQAAAARRLSTGFFSVFFRRARTEDYMDGHVTNTVSMNSYLDHEENLPESLAEITSDKKRRYRASLKAREAREFFRGEPVQRTLSWDTIDQIRYLREENPAEWSVAMLAKSFNVSEKVIIKILKSKFSPSAKVREKQNKAAAENSGSLSAAVRTEALVEFGRPNNHKVLEPKASQHPQQHNMRRTKKQVDQGHKQGLTVPSHVEYSNSAEHPGVRWQQLQHRVPEGKHDHHYRAQGQGSLHSERPLQDRTGVETDEQFTFGRFDFENVDGLTEQVKLKSQIIRRGRNFYTENGEFLYRV